MRAQRLVFISALPILLSYGLSAWPAPVHAAGPPPGPIHQLRVYEMVDRNRGAFHRRFRDHALRIMKRYSFEVVATWESESEGKTAFVYLLQWPDAATMGRQWAKFKADEEWAAIKRQSTRGLDGAIMGDILQDRTLTLTDYSPHRDLLPADD